MSSSQFSVLCLVAHIDNDGVCGALIACQTESKNGEPILETCLKLEYEFGLNLWMSRVPTDSNIADDPSRGQCDTLFARNCQRLEVVVQLVWDALLDYSNGEASTSIVIPCQKVQCNSSLLVSGHARRLNVFAKQTS